MNKKIIISVIAILCVIMMVGFSAADIKAVAPNISETEKIIEAQKKEPYCKSKAHSPPHAHNRAASKALRL